MTDDLKTKIAEAIKRAVADALYDGYDNAFANKSEWTAERGYRKGAFHDINEPMKGDYDGAGDQATQAALQAIHDEGQAIVPNGVVDALKTAEAWLTTWGSHVGNCAGGTRCTCGLEAVSAEIGHAIFQASQPKTEGEGT